MSRSKRINDFRFIVSFLVAMSVSACSSNKDDPFEQKGIAPEGKHEIYKGPLYQAYRSINDSSYRTQCDKKLSNIRSTLIEALDLKSAEIKKASIAQKNHPANLLPFAKSYLVNTPKKSAKKGWLDETYSWDLIYNYYQKNQSNNTMDFWFTMDTYVRSLITEDRKRVVYRYNMNLNHDQIDKLLSLKEVAEACRTNTRCNSPHWSDEQLKMILSIPAYAHYQNSLEKSKSFREQRKLIEKIFNRINDDFKFHGEKYNSMVTHRKADGKHIYSIPLDASSFSDQDRDILEKAITTNWNNDLNSIEISWKISTPPSNYFRFLFDLEPNNRSYVNFALQEIQLYPFTAVRTVAHEFGHVLGFDDHYYTIWDESQCEYHQQTNEEDIMSGSETGDVTEAEWQSLFDRYGDR